MRRTIENRLRRLEGTTPEVPTCVLSCWPAEESDAEDHLSCWQDEVAAGRAAVMGRALVLRGANLTQDEWVSKWGHA